MLHLNLTDFNAKITPNLVVKIVRALSLSSSLMQAAEPPQPSLDGNDVSESTSNVEQGKRLMQRQWAKAKQKSVGIAYVVRHWCQGIGHSIMHWLTIFLSWFKSFSARCQAYAIRTWNTIRSQFVKSK